MKTLSIAVLTLIVAVSASAEDALVEGGQSPDGRFEVRIARDKDSDLSDYAIHLHAAKDPKPFYTLEGIGGLLRYDDARQSCQALWHPSGKSVAITDKATRHSKEIYVLAVSDGSAKLLPLPDYVQNALGRIDATEIDQHCLSSPRNWKGDDLRISLYFSIATPERARRIYTCEVTLHVTHDDSPTVSLTKVTQPKEEEG